MYIERITTIKSKLDIYILRLHLQFPGAIKIPPSSRPNPSVAKVMVYRFGICGVCTITSIIYLIAVHGIVRNPEVGFLDVLLIALIAFALFIENQNHMFTELLFLRFGHILKHHFIHILTHVKSPHAKGKDSRMCCYRRSKALYDVRERLKRVPF